MAWGFLLPGRQPRWFCREHRFATQMPTQSIGVLGLLMLRRSIVALENYCSAAKVDKDSKRNFSSTATSQGCRADTALAELLTQRERCFAPQTPTRSRDVLLVLTTTQCVEDSKNDQMEKEIKSNLILIVTYFGCAKVSFELMFFAIFFKLSRIWLI